MELWIRSQDKEDLVKANALYIMNNQIWNEVPFYENHKKIGLTITGHNHKLAQYKTKERALEVLDEIQNLLKPKIIIKNEGKSIYGTDGNIYTTNIVGNVNTDIQELSTYVYEMPKE